MSRLTQTELRRAEFDALVDFRSDAFSQKALSKTAVRSWLQEKGYEIKNVDINQPHADFLAHKEGRSLSIEIHSISDLGRFRNLLLRTQKRLEKQTASDCEFILIITMQSHALARMAANRLTQSRWLPCKPVIGLLLNSRFEPLPQFLDLCS